MDKSSPRRLGPSQPRDSLGMGGEDSGLQLRSGLQPQLSARMSDLGGVRAQIQIFDWPPGSPPASLSHGNEPLGIRGHPATGPSSCNRWSPRTAPRGWAWGWFYPALTPGPQKAPPRGGDDQGARLGAAVPAAVSAPRPRAEHVTRWLPPAPWISSRTAALTGAPPVRERWGGGTQFFPRPARELRDARPSALPASPAQPQPRDPRPALTSGPCVAAAGLLVRHGSAAPARERSPRRSARARAGPFRRLRRHSDRV